MSLKVIAMGGTIASVADPATGAVRAAVDARDLVKGVPGIERYGPIDVRELARVNGWNVVPADMVKLTQLVQESLDDPSTQGVIVTHGTDTIEETVFFCDLTVRSEKPTIFTGSMRSGDELSADGPRNLLNAAEVASDPGARNIGAALCLNDEIHAARWVQKTDSFRVSTFQSPDHGPLGLVTPGFGVNFIRPMPRRWTTTLPAQLDAPVPIVKAYTGMEADLLDSIVEKTHASALVLEGTGLGNVPGSAEHGIREAVARSLPVVVATRVKSGGTRAVYGGPGGGVTLQRLGAVGAGTLTAGKARLLLMLLLMQHRDAETVKKAFSQAVEVLK